MTPPGTPSGITPGITPDAIGERAQRFYLPYLRAWVCGEPFFPQSFPVGKLPTEYGALREAVRRLQAGERAVAGAGYTLEMRTQQTHRYGAQSLPTRVVFATARDLLAEVGKADEFAAFTRDVALIREQLPALEDWLRARPQQVLAFAGVWPELCRVCLYFQAHPLPQRYIRELPIAVHTKFIEEHVGILRELLDALLPPEAVNSSVTPFEKRYGLRYDEPLIRLRVLDSALCERYRLPCSDLSTPLSQFAALRLGHPRCIVTENKLTFLTLPDLPGTIAIFGRGFQVELLGEIDWLRSCPVYYWGDLDAQGFQILSQVRARLPQVRSVMMDRETLDAFRAFAVQGHPAPLVELPHLTAAEQAMYTLLAQQQLRLEQERISYEYACTCLERLLDCR